MSIEDRDPSAVDPVDEQQGPRSSRVRPRKRPWWRESVLVLGSAVVLAVVVKSLLLQAFYIPSASMEPGLVKDDRILVEKVSTWGDSGPRRGDVVVFEDPGGWLQGVDVEPTGMVATALAAVGLYPTGGHLVKRVVGVAGDVVVCCDDEGRLSVNGQPLDETGFTHVAGAECRGPMTRTCDWTAGPVPEGHVFVMGDHRDDSGDSTVHMCRPEDTACVPGEEFVSVDLVVGRVLALVWPAGHARVLHRPDVYDSVPDPPDPASPGGAR